MCPFLTNKSFNMSNLEDKEKHKNPLILFNLLIIFTQLYLKFINISISFYLQHNHTNPDLQFP